MAPGDAQLDDASGCLVSQGANSRCGFIRGGIAMRGWRAGERVNRSCSHRSVSAIFHPACNTWLPSFRDGRLIVEWVVKGCCQDSVVAKLDCGLGVHRERTRFSSTRSRFGDIFSSIVECSFNRILFLLPFHAFSQGESAMWLNQLYRWRKLNAFW